VVACVVKARSARYLLAGGAAVVELAEDRVEELAAGGDVAVAVGAAA